LQSLIIVAANAPIAVQWCIEMGDGGTANELCAGRSSLGGLFLGGRRRSRLGGLGFFYHFATGTAAAVATAAAAVAGVATTVATTAAVIATAAVFVPATMLVAAAGIATRVAAGIATAVAAAFAAIVATAFASGRSFAALRLLFTALVFTAIVMTVMTVIAGPTAETAKTSAATTMAGFRLGLQTHENNGERRQTQSHAH
jgi:hypothetical protein